MLKFNNLPLSVKASIAFMVASVFEKGINLITIPIFTRVLSSDEFGKVNVYRSWSTLLGTIITFSLVGGVINNVMLDFEKEKDEFLSSILTLILFSSTISFFIYKCIEQFFGNFLGYSSSLMIFMFISIAFNSSLGLLTIKKKFDYDYKLVVLLSFFIAIMSPILSLFLIKNSSLNKADAKIYGDGIILLLLNFFVFFKIIKKGKTFINLKYWKYALKFNIPLIPNYLAYIILAQSDRIMISKFVGNDKAGIYSLAYSVASIIAIITNSVNSSFVPWTYKKMKAMSYYDIEKVTNKLSVIGYIVSVLFILIAPEFIKIMAPPSYYEAIYIIPPVVLSVYITFIFTFFANIEFYHKKTLFLMFASVFASITNVILNYFLIPRFGYIIAGYTTLFSYLMLMLMHYLFMKKIEKNRIYNIKFIFINVILSLITGLFLIKIYNNFLLRLILFVLILLLLIVYLLKILKEEK